MSIVTWYMHLHKSCGDFTSPVLTLLPLFRCVYTCIGWARPIYIYGVYIQFWPTLHMHLHRNFGKLMAACAALSSFDGYPCFLSISSASPFLSNASRRPSLAAGGVSSDNGICMISVPRVAVCPLIKAFERYYLP